MSRPLRVSEASQIALHVVLYLAESPGAAVSAADAAQALHVSFPLTAKILQWLARAGIVKSTMGPTGGYRLIKALPDIRVLDVIEAVDRPMEKKQRWHCGPRCAGRRCGIAGLFDAISQQVARQYEKPLSEL